MKLVFRGARGAVWTSWSDYALLRDNVQHYVERGVPSERFAALHAIERAVDGRVELLDAARLRGEVLSGCDALGELALSDSAVSLRTRALLSGSQIPPVRGTVLAAKAGWEPAVSDAPDQRIVQLLHGFVAAVLSITQHAVDGDKLLVVREA
jgi:hypothetical protein